MRRAPAVVATLVLASLLSCQGLRHDGGPSLDPGKNAYGLAFRKAPGEIFTEGVTVFKVKDSGKIRILRVRPEMRGSPVRYLGALIAKPDRHYAFYGVMRGYPPHHRGLGTVVKAEGALLHGGRAAAKQGFELLLGYRVLNAGRSDRTGIEVWYETGGSTRKAEIPSYMTICSQGGPPAKKCAEDADPLKKYG